MAFCDHAQLIFWASIILGVYLVRWAMTNWRRQAVVVVPRSRMENMKAAAGGACSAPPSDDAMLQPLPTPRDGVVVVSNFNTEWCGHSQRLQPTWDQLMEAYKDSPTVQLLDIKCDRYDCSSIPIRGYPSILLRKLDGSVEEYYGDRSFDDIKKFIDSASS